MPEPPLLLPAWFYLLRAVVSFMLGAYMLLVEVDQGTHARIILVAAALMLMGYAPSDLATFYRTARAD